MVAISMDYRLSKKERLNKKDFRGIKWVRGRESDHFILLLHKNQDSAKKIGVTIRKKVGGAVFRNRMRRLIKEFFRLNKDLFKDCHDHLIKVKKLPEKPTWNTIKEELRILLGGNAT
jgi:ribonuclease P protein component